MSTVTNDNNKTPKRTPRKPTTTIILIVANSDRQVRVKKLNKIKIETNRENRLPN